MELAFFRSMWIIGPHNHSLLRLYRFRDPELERAYRLETDALCAQLINLHATAMTLVPMSSCASYANQRLTTDFWLYFATIFTSLVFVLTVRFSATAKAFVIAIHALFCCVLVGFFGAMVFAQYMVWVEDVQALDPPDPLSKFLQPREAHIEQLLASYSIHVYLPWIGSQWLALSFTGMKPWTVLAYGVSILTFCGCTFACPSVTIAVLSNSTFLSVGGWMAFMVISLILESTRRASFLAQTQLAQELQSSQLADSILNH
eukprot:EG_transcript_24202